VADLALREGDFAQAARLIAAAAGVRGLKDLAFPDEDRIDRETRDRLGERYAEAVAEGAETSWAQLAEVTLAS
jgi:hypothetical protein